VLLATPTVHTSGPPPAQVTLLPVPNRSVPVPDLVGIKAPRAGALARASGLEARVIRVSGRPAGVVLAQAPTPGARVRRGSTVLLRVGRGG
jgi:beta-lactam-binding protein with PASTA domain